MEPVAASGCCFHHSCPKYLLLSTVSSCIRALGEQGSPFWPFWRLSKQLKFRSSRDVLYNCFGLSKLPECDIIASMFIMLPSIITIYGWTVGVPCKIQSLTFHEISARRETLKPIQLILRLLQALSVKFGLFFR